MSRCSVHRPRPEGEDTHIDLQWPATARAPSLINHIHYQWYLTPSSVAAADCPAVCPVDEWMDGWMDGYQQLIIANGEVKCGLYLV